MIPISDIGFVGHCHYAFTAYGKVPVEVSLSTLRNHQSTCITVDITGEPFTAKNRRANKWAFRNVSKLQFPFRGYNSVDQVRQVVRNLYDEKDGGRGQYVAVKGDELKDFFVSCGLPVCEMKREVLGDRAPKYTDLLELSQLYSMNCDNHLHGDDSSCSRRISFTFARYLDSVERGELPINTVADEQQQQQQQEEEEDMDMELVVIDCRDRVLDKICFEKHNVQYTILLK